MRLDKLTTAFQQALAEAQSLAVTRDNPYIEPGHLLAAMLAQPDGPKALLDRAGANTAALKTAMDTANRALPQVQGGGQIQAGRDLVLLLQAAEKEAGAPIRLKGFVRMALGEGVEKTDGPDFAALC